MASPNATRSLQSGRSKMQNPSSGGMATQSHPANGLSRHKGDCAKTGCTDSGGG